METQTPTWQKTEIVCSCGCGRKFTPNYRNGLLISKLTPNCRYRQSQLKERSKNEGLHQKKERCLKSHKKRAKNPIDKKLDVAWSKLVKIKSGNKCAVCSSEKALNSHHIYSRAKMSLRWSLENGICLCVGHHIGVKFSAHKTPVDFNDWLYNHFGIDFMDGLKLMAHTQSNLHEFEKEILLKELQSEIKNYGTT